MKTSIKTIGLLAALTVGLTSPLFSQVPDLTAAGAIAALKTDPASSPVYGDNAADQGDRPSGRTSDPQI